LAEEAAQIGLTDRLRITFKDGSIIHQRLSGNAPELRCYTESSTADRVAALNAAVLSMIREPALVG
jgi:phosphomannomutase